MLSPMVPVAEEQLFTRRALLRGGGCLLAAASLVPVMPQSAFAAAGGLEPRRRVRYERLVDALDGTGTPGVTRARSAEAADRLDSLYREAEAGSRSVVDEALDVLEPGEGRRFHDLSREERRERLGIVLGQSSDGAGTLAQIAVGLAVGPSVGEHFSFENSAPGVGAWNPDQVRYDALSNAPRESAPLHTSTWGQRREDW